MDFGINLATSADSWKVFAGIAIRIAHGYPEILEQWAEVFKQV